MANGAVYGQGWSLDDVNWGAFDRSKLDPELVKAVKAASLVEYNAQDYVSYLSKVFPDDAVTHAAIEHWGVEEVQHGEALGRWAEMADPGWSFAEAFRRFRAGYRPAHFESANGSVRGSRVGELVARCVVESGTSSYYSAIKEAAAEPVLAEIAGRIAADEFRHYKLFYELMDRQADAPGFWQRLYIALTRAQEADDDELAFAYYSANVAEAHVAATPYDRKTYAALYHKTALSLYREKHIAKLVQMVAKAVGASPQGRIVRFAGKAAWRIMQWKAAQAPAQKAA